MTLEAKRWNCLCPGGALFFPFAFLGFTLAGSKPLVKKICNLPSLYLWQPGLDAVTQKLFTEGGKKNLEFLALESRRTIMPEM